VNELALCAGAHGIGLGLKLLFDKLRTVCYVEREASAAASLVARMEDKALDNAPVWDDIKTFDGKPWRGSVDIITAGYPCQPFSTAGKLLGEKDPRHL
jgi:DNA (cytosine-5)-methyltransferase 1